MGSTLGFRRAAAKRARSYHSAVVDAAPCACRGDRQTARGDPVRFQGGPRRSYGLLIDRRDVSVCLKHPRFDIDVTVSADIVAFYQVWLGRVTLSEALRRRQVRLDGAPAHVDAFEDWFAWSPMAETVRAAFAERPIRPSTNLSSKLERKKAG